MRLGTMNELALPNLPIFIQPYLEKHLAVGVDTSDIGVRAVPIPGFCDWPACFCWKNCCLHHCRLLLVIVSHFFLFLSSAKETADMSVKEVFCAYGLLSDTVSDCSSYFIYAVWKAFFTSIGSTITLTSGYYPQSKSQAELANQDQQNSLCVVTSNPTTCTTLLPWVEYPIH